MELRAIHEGLTQHHFLTIIWLTKYPAEWFLPFSHYCKIAYSSHPIKNNHRRYRQYWYLSIYVAQCIRYFPTFSQRAKGELWHLFLQERTGYIRMSRIWNSVSTGDHLQCKPWQQWQGDIYRSGTAGWNRKMVEFSRLEWMLDVTSGRATTFGPWLANYWYRECWTDTTPIHFPWWAR